MERAAGAAAHLNPDMRINGSRTGDTPVIRQSEMSLSILVAGLAAAVAVIMVDGPFGLWDLAVGLSLLTLLIPTITKGGDFS